MSRDADVLDLAAERMTKMARDVFGQVGVLAKSLQDMQKAVDAREADLRDIGQRITKLERGDYA